MIVRNKLWSVDVPDPTFLVCVLQEVWWALLLLPVAHPFYVPGVAPRNFREGDVVDIKVILKSFCMIMRHFESVYVAETDGLVLQAVKLTSSHTQLPYEYYSLPFCKPDAVFYKGENLGES